MKTSGLLAFRLVLAPASSGGPETLAPAAATAPSSPTHPTPWTTVIGRATAVGRPVPPSDRVAGNMNLAFAETFWTGTSEDARRQIRMFHAQLVDFSKLRSPSRTVNPHGS